MYIDNVYKIPVSGTPYLKISFNQWSRLGHVQCGRRIEYQFVGFPFHIDRFGFVAIEKQCHFISQHLQADPCPLAAVWYFKCGQLLADHMHICIRVVERYVPFILQGWRKEYAQLNNCVQWINHAEQIATGARIWSYCGHHSKFK